MARTLTKEQGYTLVNALYKQSTGQDAIAVVDDTTFTAVASGVMRLTTNQIMKGLSEMLAQVIVSVRPYTAPFRLNWNSESAFGAHTFKISYLDNAEAEIDPAWTIADGQRIGTHNVKLPKVYEADIWGDNVIKAFITITKDQLKTAMTSAGMLARFFSGLFQNIDDQMEQQREAMCRSNILNLVGGVYSLHDTLDEDLLYMKNATIHLLTEFKAQYGGEYADLNAIRAVPAAYEQFIKFCFARMENVSKLMGNRDKFYHVNPFADPKVEGTTGIIMRHTEPADLRCYICDPYLTEINTQVLSSVFHNGNLQYVPHESILYWQAPETPEKVKVTPLMFNKDGTTTAAAEQSIDNLFAVMYDKDAAGVGIVDEETGDTPYDVERKAMNRYWHKDVKSYNDFTEKAVIFLMD